MLQDTSLQAFSEILPHLGARQKQVLKAIYVLGACCNQRIADYLNWPINYVCGRVKELRDKGLVVEAGRAKNRFGRAVHLWRVSEFKETFF